MLILRLVILTIICAVVIENASSTLIGMVHDDIVRADFPADFVFGAGTSANQVEGAGLEDGRTLSIQDAFVQTSGLYDGPNPLIGCDGYHKYKEDIQLMADMGLEAYRFSISWSRLIPNGRGSINLKGLQYYNNVINELVAHGIQPHVTLNHWDLPQVLEDEYDGWLSRKSIDDFVAYADVCFREFGDRVLHWTTFNEPNNQALFGYNFGLEAPGRCSYPFENCAGGNSSTEPYLMAHNTLLAHAYADKLYRTKYKAQQGLIGIDLYAAWYEPYNADVLEDVLASQRAKTFIIGWFVNPLVFGDYPDIMKKSAGSRIPTFTEAEKNTIKGSFDFLGVNHYAAEFVKDNPTTIETKAIHFYSDLGAKLTVDAAFLDQSKVNPSTLPKILEYIKQEYGNPLIYVHENGKPILHNGSLNDTIRIDYLITYIRSILDAIRNGSNTKGYFVWSFIDTLEFSRAYEYSLGLHYVDFNDKDLKRVPKLSAHWYSSFLQGKTFHDEA